MPSVKNPNHPSRNRLIARASKNNKANAKKATNGQLRKLGISKADARRGARPGLLPNSGPNKAVSGKKQRKLEKKMGYALKRKMAADGEVEMKEAPAVKETKAKGEAATMDVDIS